MSIKAKNTSIIFAIATLMMVMPLSTQYANGDGTAIVDAVCGFNEEDADSFGTLTRGAASVTEQTVTFTPTASSTGTGTIFVVADDWFGTGDRASGTITINADITATETIEVHQLSYVGNDAASTNLQFLTGASVTAIQTAASLAASINDRDGGANGVIATTSGTAVVTIKSQEGGTVGNGVTFDLVENSAGTTSVSNALLTGGGVGATTVPHLAAETTHFFIVADATTNPTTSTGEDYDTGKTAMPVDGDTVGLEMISGTVNTQDVEISFEISTEFLTPADGTITLASVANGDTVTLDGITYTAQAGASSGTAFQVGLATDILDADELVSIINGAQARLTADNAGGSSAVVTVTFDTSGDVGNIVPLSSSDGATLAIASVTGGLLDGGTEYLQNLPYDGAITQDLTFTIACE